MPSVFANVMLPEPPSDAWLVVENTTFPVVVVVSVTEAISRRSPAPGSAPVVTVRTSRRAGVRRDQRDRAGSVQRPDVAELRQRDVGFVRVHRLRGDRRVILRVAEQVERHAERHEHFLQRERRLLELELVRHVPRSGL